MLQYVMYFTNYYINPLLLLTLNSNSTKKLLHYKNVRAIKFIEHSVKLEKMQNNKNRILHNFIISCCIFF